MAAPFPSPPPPLPSSPPPFPLYYRHLITPHHPIQTQTQADTIEFITLSPSPPLPPAPLPILLACNATRFSSLCVSSLTSPSKPPSPSPLSLLSTSFSASLSSIPPAIFTAKSILSFSSNNPNRKNAATNCIEFLTLSLYRLTIASKLMSISSPPFPSVGILYSAALLYQYECWSAYKYVNDSSTVSDAMAFLANNLTALTSNTISMLAALQRYGNDMSLWGSPQRERWVLA